MHSHTPCTHTRHGTLTPPQVEFDKVSAEGKSSGSTVIRACIAKLPPGYAQLKISQMTDQIWGVDGFDT